MKVYSRRKVIANIRDHNNMYSNERIIIYFYGITCSFSGLQIAGLAISNYFLLALIVIKILNQHARLHIYFKNYSQKYIIIFTMNIILSIICSIGWLPNTWIMNSVSCLIKYCIAFFAPFLFYNTDQLLEVRREFFKGLYVGAIIQMIWGFAQIVLYSLFEFKLNTFVFQNILGLEGYNWDSYISGRILRMKGIGWEAANFALVMIMGYILACAYKKSYMIRILFICALALSTSRSGYIAIFVVICWQFIQNNIKKKNKYISKNNIASVVLVLLIIATVSVTYGDAIIERLELTFSSMVNIFDTSDNLASNSIHISYYVNLLEILKQNGFVRTLFGCGYFSSGYPYSCYDSVVSNRISMIGWNPESDAITLIVGNGILGFVLYYFSIIRAFLNHRKDEYGLMILAVFSLGITYLSIRGTWSLFIAVLCMIDNTPIVNLNKPNQKTVLYGNNEKTLIKTEDSSHHR